MNLIEAKIEKFNTLKQAYEFVNSLSEEIETQIEYGINTQKYFVYYKEKNEIKN